MIIPHPTFMHPRWRALFRTTPAGARPGTDIELCHAVAEMSRGLIDADLGHGLLKKRIARSGAGKRGGFRAIVANRSGSAWFFIDAFAKSDCPNLSRVELMNCRSEARHWLSLGQADLLAAREAGDLKEINCNA